MAEANFVSALKASASKLIRRAWEEAAFKQTLLTNPNQAIEQATGLKVPAGMKVNLINLKKFPP